MEHDPANIESIKRLAVQTSETESAFKLIGNSSELQSAPEFCGILLTDPEKAPATTFWLCSAFPHDANSEREFIARLAKYRPVGMAVHGIRSIRDIEKLSVLAEVAEIECGLTDRNFALLAVIDTVEGALNAASYSRSVERLSALCLDTHAVASALGVKPEASPLTFAQGQLVMAAHLARAKLIKMVSTTDGSAVTETQSEGYRGVMILTPDACSFQLAIKAANSGA